MVFPTIHDDTVQTTSQGEGTEKTCESLPKTKPNVSAGSEAVSQDNPITNFSRRDIPLTWSTPIKPSADNTVTLRMSTPVKPNANNTMAFREPAPSVDLWDRVEEKRRKIATRNQQLSPFLHLPPEIRNKIYSCVLGNRTFRFKDAIHRPHAQLRTSERHILSLLLVCHQIYSEASLLPYTLNTFSFREFNISLKPFLDHRRLAQFRAITTIELVTYRAGRMWADANLFSDDFKEIGESEVLERLPNLREMRVIVDMNSSLYVAYGAAGFDFNLISWRQRMLEDAVSAIRPDVYVRFFLA